MRDATKYAVYSFFGALSLAAVIAACSAPDPGDIPLRNPAKDPKLARMPEGGSVIGPSTIAVGAFEGAPGYAPGTAQLSSVHAKHAEQLEIGKQDPYEKDCLVCHTGTGVAAAAGKTFVVAGSVRAIKNGASAGKGVEVRIRAPDGKAETAYTDDAGNFFLMRTFAGAAAIPLNSIVGIRNGTTTANMVGIVGGGPDTTGCAKTPACHGTGSPQGPVYLLAQ